VCHQGQGPSGDSHVKVDLKDAGSGGGEEEGVWLGGVGLCAL
jgi:hypothetical protein